MEEKQYQNYSFSAILYAVSSSADIPAPIILSKSRNVEVVDARHILISILSECGWHQARIARQLGTSEASISIALDRFANRLKFGGFFINSTLRKARTLLGLK